MHPEENAFLSLLSTMEALNPHCYTSGASSWLLQGLLPAPAIQKHALGGEWGVAAIQVHNTAAQFHTSLGSPQSAICSHNHSRDTFQIPNHQSCLFV